MEPIGVAAAERGRGCRRLTLLAADGPRRGCRRAGLGRKRCPPSLRRCPPGRHTFLANAAEATASVAHSITQAMPVL